MTKNENNVEITESNTKNTTQLVKQLERVDRINLTGEIFLRERIDEETKEKKYSVAISVDNPFAELFEGGKDNEYNLKLSLGFKETQAKSKAQFMYKAKRVLETAEKIDISGFIQRRKFFDTKQYKWVRFIGIFINSPFDDGVIGLTIPRAETLGLVEMFADEILTILK